MLVLLVLVFSFNIGNLSAEYWLYTGTGQQQMQDPYLDAYRAYINRQVGMQEATIYGRAQLDGAMIDANRRVQEARIRSVYDLKNAKLEGVESLGYNQELRELGHEYDMNVAEAYGKARLEQAKAMGGAQTAVLKKCWENGTCAREYERRMGDDARADTTINRIGNAVTTYEAMKKAGIDMYNSDMTAKKFRTDSYYDYIRYLRAQHKSLR